MPGKKAIIPDLNDLPEKILYKGGCSIPSPINVSYRSLNLCLHSGGECSIEIRKIAKLAMTRVDFLERCCHSSYRLLCDKAKHTLLDRYRPHPSIKTVQSARELFELINVCLQEGKTAVHCMDILIHDDYNLPEYKCFWEYQGPLAYKDYILQGIYEEVFMSIFGQDTSGMTDFELYVEGNQDILYFEDKEHRYSIVAAYS